MFSLLPHVDRSGVAFNYLLDVTDSGTSSWRHTHTYTRTLTHTHIRAHTINHTRTHVHTWVQGHTDYLLFLLLVPVVLGRAARLCLSQTLPLCPLVCTVSLFLGQMTRSITAGFITEVQWLNLTRSFVEKKFISWVFWLMWVNWAAWWCFCLLQVAARWRHIKITWCQMAASHL